MRIPQSVLFGVQIEKTKESRLLWSSSRSSTLAWFLTYSEQNYRYEYEWDRNCTYIPREIILFTFFKIYLEIVMVKMTRL